MRSRRKDGIMTPDDILELWFGTVTPSGMTADDRSALWWRKSDETDAALRARFSEHVEGAAAGQLDAWRETASGCIALIVTLDQLTRNIFRGTPRAFAADPKAQALCLAGLDRAHDQALPLIQRVFFYMPLEHAEDARLQARSCALFQALCDLAPAEHRETFAYYLDYAEKHRAIIDRFGRFPHRNAILGRETTAEEAVFLQQPGSSF